MKEEVKILQNEIEQENYDPDKQKNSQTPPKTSPMPQTIFIAIFVN